MSEQIMEQVDSLSTAMSEAKQETTKAEVQSSSWFNWFDEETKPSAEDEDSVMIKQKIKQSSVDLFSQFISSTPMVMVQVLTTIVLILFILIFSQRIFLAFNTLFVASERRESARQFAESVQHQLSKYIVTVSIINIGLGFATFVILYFLNVDNAILLGSLMGLLNFVPYIGPLIALSLVLLAGIVQWGFELHVLIPLFAVLTLNVVESQFITPGILAKNMQINPLFIILWLLVCGWFWGMLGVLIALPLLVCIKLTLAQAKGTKPWIKLLSA
jgi:predicted PurR-regulated permease PerM